MGVNDMPFVAVIGGLWQLDAAERNAAIQAGRDLGVELARAGFGIVVYFSDPNSLEPHVVSGYVGAASNQPGAIRVRFAESQRGQVKFPEERQRPELFQHRLFPGGDWEVPFYGSLAEEDGVDAVILLAGATSTLIAGQIAVARKLPILPIDVFGGSARKIWSQLASAAPGQLESWSTRKPAECVAQLKKECEAAKLARNQRKERASLLESIESGRKKTPYEASAFFLLLVAVVLAFRAPITLAFPMIMFSGLITAGATGALIRSILSNTKDTHPSTSLILGGVAGFVVGLAYLIPYWIGGPAVLDFANAATSTQKIQFISAVLVALSAGVGFDTVFSKLQKGAESVAVGPKA